MHTLVTTYNSVPNYNSAAVKMLPPRQLIQQSLPTVSIDVYQAGPLPEFSQLRPVHQVSYHPIPISEALPELPPRPDYAAQVRIGSVGDLLIGGIVGSKFNGGFADAIGKIRADGFSLDNLKGVGKLSLKAGGLSAGLSGAVSAFQNIKATVRGDISEREAFGNIGADTIGGLMTGTTAGLGAGAATLALRSFGLAGLPLTIGAAAAGALGGLGGSKLYEVTGLRNRVFDAFSAFLG